MVVLDGPPVLGLADAPLLANHAEATIVVVAAQATRIDALQAAIRRLQFARARVIGAVLTRFDIGGSDEHYGYGYGHHAQTRTR